jgi:hypothetical protein
VKFAMPLMPKNGQAERTLLWRWLYEALKQINLL